MSQFKVLVEPMTKTFMVIDTINNIVVFKTTNASDARDFALAANFEQDTRIFAEFG